MAVVATTIGGLAVSGAAGKTTAATIAAITTAATVASTALQVVGAIQQSQAASAQANLQAGILEQQATRDRQQAASDEADFRARQSRALASRRAALGASGVDPGAGAPLLVSEDFAGEVELQALRIRTGGEVTATRAEQQATLQRFQGRAAKKSGFVGGGALLLTGKGKSFGANGTLPGGRFETDATGKLTRRIL